MGSREKGNKNERKARDRLQEDGYLVHKTAGGRRDRDAFGVADLIAMGRGEVKLVQVKTNGFTGIQELSDRVREVYERLDAEMPRDVRVELWSRYDGQGGAHGYSASWRKARWDEAENRFVEFHDGRVEDQIG